MKQLLIDWLRRLLLWLDPLPPLTPPQPDPLCDVARLLMLEQDSYDGRSGEAKRHQVLAALMKACPEQRTRDLAMAIERVMQERE